MTKGKRFFYNLNIFNAITGVISAVLILFDLGETPMANYFNTIMHGFIGVSIPSLFWLFTLYVFKKIPDFIYYLYIIFFLYYYVIFLLFVFVATAEIVEYLSA